MRSDLAAYPQCSQHFATTPVLIRRSRFSSRRLPMRGLLPSVRDIGRELSRSRFKNRCKLATWFVSRGEGNLPRTRIARLRLPRSDVARQEYCLAGTSPRPERPAPPSPRRGRNMPAQGRARCEQREHQASPWVTGPPTFVALKGHNMSAARPKSNVGDNNRKSPTPGYANRRREIGACLNGHPDQRLWRRLVCSGM